MTLIAESKYTSPWPGGVPSSLKVKASAFKFDISSLMLSKPYSLVEGDTVKGMILRVEDADKKEYPELIGKEIEFVIYPLLLNDYLFISKSDWEEKFREFGLVLSFYLSVKLNCAITKSGTSIDLYTKADISI
ncbi:MAG: hypothetical protein NTY37_11980 [Methanothrix sp.]|nr:hypothetical protein [Methanothrix sp.]